MVRKSLNSVPEVSFSFVPGLEFITALYRSANCDLFDEVYRDHRVQQDNEVVACLRDMRERLSPFMRRELEFFFKLKHSHADQAFHQLMFSPAKPCTVDELMREVEMVEPSEIVRYLIEDITDEEINESLLKVWNDDQSDGSNIRLLEWARETSIGHPITARVLECVADLRETKERFKSLLRSFYIRSYASYEELLRKQSTEVIPRIEALFQTDETRFFREHLGPEAEVFDKVTLIHVSVLTQYGSFVSLTGSSEVPHSVRLGIHVENVAKQNAELDLVEKLCKVVSDKNRLEILRLLSARPWYGQELAKQLALSPAAISYHMGFLHDAHLISLKRADQKGYYVLDKERLKALFGLLEETLGIE